MNKPIVFLLSILASTIAPSVFSYDSAYAQEAITQQRCLMTSPADTSPAAKPEDRPIGTAKDLFSPVQKVELRCFFGTGPGAAIVEPRPQPPSNQPIVVDPFAFTIESGKIKVPVFRITF
jgi:hypothetical protein